MLRSHLVFPVGLLLALALGLQLSHADLWWADRLYAWSGGQWAWRDAWLTETLLHVGGRKFVAAGALGLLALALASGVITPLAPWRATLGYLLGSAVLAALLVNLAKQLTHVDCPWDLLRYGGERPYIGLFEPHPRTFPYGECFPAGHASAGYAWLGLYYVARAWRPRWRWAVLGAVLALGTAFGLAQQLRGAHFLSHDLWSLLLCWAIATLGYWWRPVGPASRILALTGRDG